MTPASSEQAAIIRTERGLLNIPQGLSGDSSTSPMTKSTRLLLAKAIIIAEFLTEFAKLQIGEHRNREAIL